MKKEIIDYWENQWLAVISQPHQEEHSKSIPNDFIKILPDHSITYNSVKEATTVLDFAFGTGHMVYSLSKFTRAKFTGVEISGVAVGYATATYGNDRIKFYKRDILEEGLEKDYDLIVTSNTLEHFKDPYIPLNFLLSHCKELLILVPNKGTANDGYNGEGSAGHVYSFSVDSFKDYEILDSFTFYTHGWTEGENPLQLVVLLKGGL